MNTNRKTPLLAVFLIVCLYGITLYGYTIYLNQFGQEYHSISLSAAHAISQTLSQTMAIHEPLPAMEVTNAALDRIVSNNYALNYAYVSGVENKIYAQTSGYTSVNSKDIIQEVITPIEPGIYRLHLGFNKGVIEQYSSNIAVASLLVFLLLTLMTVVALVFYNRKIYQPLRVLYKYLDARKTETGTKLPDITQAGLYEIERIYRAVNAIVENKEVANKEVESEQTSVYSDIDQSYKNSNYTWPIIQGYDLISAKVQDADVENEFNITQPKRGELLGNKEFFMSFNREIESSLHSVFACLQLLKNPSGLTYDQLDNLSGVENDVSRVLALLNDVHQLLLKDPVNKTTEDEPLELKALIEDCVQSVSSAAQRKNIILLNLVDPVIELWADVIAVRRVISSLLDNAVKSSVLNAKVKIYCEAQEQQKLKVSISYTAGFSEKETKRLSTVFEGDNLKAGSAQQEWELMFVSSLVNSLGDSIGVEPQRGGATVLWFTTSGILSETKREDKKDKLDTVLVIEDNETNQKVLLQQLQLLGVNADLAENGLSGLGLWEKNQYGLILTDYNMPDLNGFEVAKIIREREYFRGRETPIVLISANVLEETGLLNESIIDDFLTKPVEMRMLHQLVLSYMENTKQQHPGVNTADGRNSDTEYQLLNVDKLVDVVGGDFSIQSEIINIFLQSYPAIVQDLRQAFNSRSLVDVAQLAHKLKSSTKSVCAESLSSVLDNIEHAAIDKRWQDIHEYMTVLDTQILLTRCAITQYLDESQKSIDLETFGNSEFKCLTIMVVDDDDTTLKQISALLLSLGVGKVTTAPSGEVALTLMDECKSPDLLFCDLQMPGMDGIEFLRYVSQRHYQGGVVLVSGSDKKVLRTVSGLAHEHQLNILGALEKPVTANSLLSVIQQLDLTVCENTPEFYAAITEGDIRRGLKKSEFELYYQPKVNIASMKPVGMESLLRWNHPVYGTLTPKNFIPLAEKLGLIDEFTPIIMRQALNLSKLCEQQGYDLKISVNISVDSLAQLGLPEQIAAFLEKAEMDSSTVVLEVTESRIMDNITVPLEVLTRMRLKGFELSIDDFGTGYSTLEQLRRIPFGELKIDRAFVTGVSKDDEAKAILESSVSLAKKLDLSVVAEGVETKEDYELVMHMGCDVVQGFLISKPIRSMEFLQWLSTWNTNRFKEQIETA